MHIIITGGTLDSFFDKKQQRIAPLRHSAVVPYMEKTFADWDLSFSILSLKDARDITEHDLDEALTIIQSSDTDCFLLTHGFQTMADSMDYFVRHTHGLDVRIMFVGSRMPLDLEGSDAPEQLRTALFALKSQASPCVSACVDGCILDSQALRQWWYDAKLQSDWVV